VAIVRLNRPAVLNALNQALLADLVERLEELDRDPGIRAIVITGNGRAFAAGADIAEMAELTAVEMAMRPQRERWERIRRIKAPTIAAVCGLALGGGCELALTCDMIVAAETARFGQAEINLGILPGGGGTQRLTRAAGKARAMEMILTGRQIGAREAFAAGMISRVVPSEQCLVEAIRLAHDIAAKPPVAIRMAKQAILAADEMPLGAGLDYERRNFEVAFGTADRVEGMRAFLEKRVPEFEGQ
jgi:enoyl-CoA hydratase